MASMDNVHCKDCGRDITYKNWARHVNSMAHKKSIASSRISKDPAKATIKQRENSEIVIDSIMKANPNIDIEGIFNIMKENYALATIENYLRLGYLRVYHDKLSKKELARAEVFMRDIKDSIADEQDAKERVKPYNTFEIIKTDIPDIVKLYIIMPLRSESFCKIKLWSTARSDDDEQNYINTTTHELFTYNNKTTAFEHIKLDIHTRNILKNFTDMIDTNTQICSNSKNLQRLLDKYLNVNTYDVRRVYAIDYPKHTYASRVLGHKITTHRGLYQQ